MQALERKLLDRLQAGEARSIAFLQASLRAPSPNPPGDTRAVAALLQVALQEAGLQPTVIASQPGMLNLVARFDAPRPGCHLVLIGHMDVFPAAPHEWSRSPGAARSSTAASMTVPPVI